MRLIVAAPPPASNARREGGGGGNNIVLMTEAHLAVVWRRRGPALDWDKPLPSRSRGIV